LTLSLQSHKARLAGLRLPRARIMLPLSVIALLALAALFAAWLTPDPKALDPMARLLPPSLDHWMGTDQFGRSVFARVIHGGQTSLVVGIAVMIATTLAGVFLGLVSGFSPQVDKVLMRLMDAVMAIPAILLAIAMLALFGAGTVNVILAITIPEIPRMARVVRGAVLTIREQPYIEAAITNGARLPRLLVAHVLPGTVPAILVQASYVLAAAVLMESILSFLGAGAPPEVPSWGNIISEGRLLFTVAPWVVMAPGACIALLVLSVNLLGDALRDAMDPRMRRRLA